MRRSSFCVAIFLALLLVPMSEAAPQIYKSNVRTAQHVSVPGTRVAVVPPQGAVPASGFTGFEIKSRGIAYEIVDRMGASYAASEAELTAEALQGQGIKLLDTTKVVLNEKPASLLTCTIPLEKTPEGVGDGSGDEEAGLVLLVFGDDRLTTFIYGYYPLSDSSARSALRTSMLSVIFEAEQKENSGGGYTVSSAGTSLKFVSESNMTRYYTVGGEPIGTTVETAVFYCTELRQSISPGDRENFAKDVLARYLKDYDEYEILSEQRINYGGLEGIELIASFKGAVRRDRTASGGIVRRAMPGRGYLAVLFGDSGEGGRTFTFQGLAVRDAESYLSQFRQITSTFAIQK